MLTRFVYMRLRVTTPSPCLSWPRPTHLASAQPQALYNRHTLRFFVFTCFTSKSVLRSPVDISILIYRTDLVWNKELAVLTNVFFSLFKYKKVGIISRGVFKHKKVGGMWKRYFSNTLHIIYYALISISVFMKF